MWTRRFAKSNSASRFATRLFEQAMTMVSPKIKQLDCYYKGDGKREFGTMSPEGVCYLYDFVIPALKLCIELQGAFWHADPMKYQPGDMIRLGGQDVLVDDIWSRDAAKRKLMEDRGFRVVDLWYRKRRDFNTLLRKCVEVIEEQYSIHGKRYEKVASHQEDV